MKYLAVDRVNLGAEVEPAMAMYLSRVDCLLWSSALQVGILTGLVLMMHALETLYFLDISPLMAVLYEGVWNWVWKLIVGKIEHCPNRSLSKPCRATMYILPQIESTHQCSRHEGTSGAPFPNNIPTRYGVGCANFQLTVCWWYRLDGKVYRTQSTCSSSLPNIKFGSTCVCHSLQSWLT